MQDQASRSPHRTGQRKARHGKSRLGQVLCPGHGIDGTDIVMGPLRNATAHVDIAVGAPTRAAPIEGLCACAMGLALLCPSFRLTYIWVAPLPMSTGCAFGNWLGACLSFASGSFGNAWKLVSKGKAEDDLARNGKYRMALKYSFSCPVRGGVGSLGLSVPLLSKPTDETRTQRGIRMTNGTLCSAL